MSHYISHEICHWIRHQIWWTHRILHQIWWRNWRLTEFFTKFSDKFVTNFFTKHPGIPSSECPIPNILTRSELPNVEEVPLVRVPPEDGLHQHLHCSAQGQSHRQTQRQTQKQTQRQTQTQRQGASSKSTIFRQPSSSVLWNGIRNNCHRRKQQRNICSEAPRKCFLMKQKTNNFSILLLTMSMWS